MNPAIALGALMVAGAGAGYYFMQSPRKDLRDRIAAIDAGAGVDPGARANNLMRRLLDERRSQALTVKLQEAGWYTCTPQMLFQRALVRLIVGLCAGFVRHVVFSSSHARLYRSDHRARGLRRVFTVRRALPRNRQAQDRHPSRVAGLSGRARDDGRRRHRTQRRARRGNEQLARTAR